jgi:hypothetical protein
MLVDLRTPLGLAPLELPTLAPRDLSYMQKMVNLKMCNAWGAKSIMVHDQEQPTQFNL